MVPIWYWNFSRVVIGPAATRTGLKERDVPRAKKIEGNLDAIAAKRAALEAELAELTEAERRAREAERDAGRHVLLGALGKVKIARMDRSVATAIAKAIEKHGSARIAEALAAL